ncbi:MAG: triose-phosphate isomerase [Deltaproteobacteria bacterium]|uniref:Triosephosphate isomerase n=1 Tax=Candidatus Zymogenus saltonus TaxID=2844893 RepID=A0A9D8PR47_9DELT|nr:triose-phosphate isomerase [Candidatus Zymogenus saltonus]
MREKLIAANWKMNMALKDAISLASELVKRIGDIEDREIAVAPNFTVLYAVGEVLDGSNIKLSAQNLFYEQKGAYTGETSAEMIKAVGAHMVIIGHSERRNVFGDTDEEINKRIRAAINAGLVPIFCVGEKLSERKEGRARDVVERQIVAGLSGIIKEGLGDLVIAYEPVWAIGTGETAAPEQAQEMHEFIRGLAADKIDKSLANNLKILYGGSVTPENVWGLLSMPDIDGALVGGASLKADSFEKIVKWEG